MNHKTFKERLEEILAGIAGDTFDYADSDDGEADRNEAVYSATKSHLPKLITLFEDYTKAIVGEDKAYYVASPPIMLPVATNPHEIEEVEYQRNKIMRETENFKIIMAQSQLRQTIIKSSKTILRGSDE